MNPSALKISPRTLTLALGALAFIAAFVWLLTTRGPLAPVGVEIASVTRDDLNPGVYGIGTVEARHAYAVGPIQAGRLLRVWVTVKGTLHDQKTDSVQSLLPIFSRLTIDTLGSARSASV